MDREKLKAVRGERQIECGIGRMLVDLWSRQDRLIDALSDPAPAQAAGGVAGEPRTLPLPKRIWSFDDRAAQQDSCDEWLATLPAPTYDLKMAYWQGWYEAFLVYDRTNGRPPPTLKHATPSTIDAALAAPASPAAPKPSVIIGEETIRRLRACEVVETDGAALYPADDLRPNPAPPTVIISPELLATLLAGKTIETPLVRLVPRGLSAAAQVTEARAIAEEMIADRLHQERLAIGAKAREWACNYTPGSDGRNTFVLFAEWAEGRTATLAAEEG